MMRRIDPTAPLTDPCNKVALTWIVEAVNNHKILSPGCVSTGELKVLKTASAGLAAFVLLPKYCLKVLNDPTQSLAAGHFKQALMPSGNGGSHATVGLDAVLWRDAPRPRCWPRRRRGEAHGMVWRQGRWRLRVPEDDTERPSPQLRHQRRGSRISSARVGAESSQFANPQPRTG
jgi:hypothetical protein